MLLHRNSAGVGKEALERSQVSLRAGIRCFSLEDVSAAIVKMLSREDLHRYSGRQIDGASLRKKWSQLCQSSPLSSKAVKFLREEALPALFGDLLKDPSCAALQDAFGHADFPLKPKVPVELTLQAKLACLYLTCGSWMMEDSTAERDWISARRMASGFPCDYRPVIGIVDTTWFRHLAVRDGFPESSHKGTITSSDEPLFSHSLLVSSLHRPEYGAAGEIGRQLDGLSEFHGRNPFLPFDYRKESDGIVAALTGGTQKSLWEKLTNEEKDEYAAAFLFSNFDDTLSERSKAILWEMLSRGEQFDYLGQWTTSDSAKQRLLTLITATRLLACVDRHSLLEESEPMLDRIYHSVAGAAYAMGLGAPSLEGPLHTQDWPSTLPLSAPCPAVAEYLAKNGAPKPWQQPSMFNSEGAYVRHPAPYEYCGKEPEQIVQQFLSGKPAIMEALQSREAEVVPAVGSKELGEIRPPQTKDDGLLDAPPHSSPKSKEDISMESPGMTKELHHAPPIRKERVLNATPLNSQFSRTMKPAPVLKPLENPDAKVGELSRVEFRIDSASNSVIARIRMRGNSFTPAIREKLEGIGSQKAPRSLANSDGEVEIQILKNPHEFQRSEIPRIEALFNDDRPGNLDVTGLMEAPLVRYLLACGSPPGSTAVTNGRGIKLKNVVLRAENYSGMSFSEAQLENVAFVGCDLVATSFKNVRGTRVLFDSCNAHYADFGNSMFSHSSFSSEVSALSKSSKGVNTLKGASFNNARMSDSSFRNCDLRGADLRGLMQDDLDRELGKGRFGDGVAGLEKKSKEIALTQIRLKNWTGSVFRMSGEGATLLDDDQRQLFISLSDTCSVTTPVKMSPHKALQVIERNPLTRSMNCYRLVSPAGTVISIDPDFERSTMGILVENPSPSGGIVSSELSEGRLNDDPDVVVRHILALFLEEEEVALSRRRNKLRNETYV